MAEEAALRATYVDNPSIGGRDDLGELVAVAAVASEFHDTLITVGIFALTGREFDLPALADALREEEAGHGVRVSSVYPGRTATDMQRKVREQEGAPYDPAAFTRPETVAATVASMLDAPRDAALTDVTVRPGAGL